MTNRSNEILSSVKQQWIAALRSDEYTQTKGTLKADDGHCCLGVLCDLYAKAHPKARWYIDEDNKHIFVEDSDHPRVISQEMPPEIVLQWATGLRYVQAWVVDVDDAEQSLDVLNDTFGYSFDQIADLIEEKFIAV